MKRPKIPEGMSHKLEGVGWIYHVTSNTVLQVATFEGFPGFVHDTVVAVSFGWLKDTSLRSVHESEYRVISPLELLAFAEDGVKIVHLPENTEELLLFR
jgi:hypothetical protein